MIIKQIIGGIPGGSGVKNPPADAGDTGSVPGPGRPHSPQGLSSRAQGLQLPSPPARGPALNKSGYRIEQPTHRTGRAAATRHEQTNAHAAMQTNKPAINKQSK